MIPGSTKITLEISAVLLKYAPMEIQRSADRHHDDHGWTKTAHNFSFADYYDPKRMHWGALRVFSDNVIAAGEGFPTHPHQDMDIVTYVLDGKLEHRDSLGNHGVVNRYGVQYMSAGTGVQHSEFNASTTEPLHVFQMWVLPQHAGIDPTYGQHNNSAQQLHNHWLTIASGQAGVDAEIRLDADATFSVAEIETGIEVRHVTAAGRRAFMFVAEGDPEISVRGEEDRQRLGSGDSARIDSGEEILVHGPGHVVLWDVPADA
jgi:redox-sensitive bicupin YhaK (pirin superfamily)